MSDRLTQSLATEILALGDYVDGTAETFEEALEEAEVLGADVGWAGIPEGLLSCPMDELMEEALSVIDPETESAR